MKKFKEYITEEMMPYAQTEKGFVGIDNGPVRDNINIHLTSVTAKPYATPYHALEIVRKVLAPFNIFIPHTNFLDGDAGHEVFNTNQFGDKYGQTNAGDVVLKTTDPYHVYFEYQMNDKGSFDIFCEIVNDDELEEILNDIEAELEEGETTDGDGNDAEDSFDDYKAKNQVNEEMTKNQKRRASRGALQKKLDDLAIKHIQSGRPNSQLIAKRIKGVADKVGNSIKNTPMFEDDDPCWKGYEMVGMKKKGGKKVPNCVPVNEATLGGPKWKRKRNPNNAKSTKTPEQIKSVMDKAYGGVADSTGLSRKRKLQLGNAAFQVGLAQKYNTPKK